MIYVPDYDIVQCAYIRDSNTLRVYDSVPIRGETINYKDYYINSHYVYTDGSTTFSNYSTLPVCLSDDVITTNYYYRNDFNDILVIFGIIVVFVWFMLSLLIKKLLKGRRYL